MEKQRARSVVAERASVGCRRRLVRPRQQLPVTFQPRSVAPSHIPSDIGRPSRRRATVRSRRSFFQKRIPGGRCRKGSQDGLLAPCALGCARNRLEHGLHHSQQTCPLIRRSMPILSGSCPYFRGACPALLGLRWLKPRGWIPSYGGYVPESAAANAQFTGVHKCESGTLMASKRIERRSSPF